MTNEQILDRLKAKPQSLMELTRYEHGREPINTSVKVLKMFREGILDRDEHGNYSVKVNK